MLKNTAKKMEYISLSKPNLDIDIMENMRECIETGMITDGRFVSDFEREIANYVNVDEAVATSSGTSALHIGLRLLGVGSGDEVVAPNLTFIAAVNPIVYQGASPILLDCDDDFCLDPDKLSCFLEKNCEKRNGEVINIASGCVVRAIVVVHVFGNIANMEAIMDIANAYGLPVLEDATEALGSSIGYGTYKGQFAGTIGNLGAYSFNANKIITAGGGGMLVSGTDNSNASELLNEARHLSTTAKSDKLFFKHNQVGYNYRMLNIQAAIVISKIKRLSDFIEKTQSVHKLYSQLFDEMLKTQDANSGAREIRFLPLQQKNNTNAWFFCLFVKEGRDDLMDFLIKNNIDVRPVWELINRQPSYQTAQHSDLAKSELYQHTILNLPCHTGIKDTEVAYVVKKIREWLSV
jgi:dTDP-4-amino-4,6-dideoxygalactose transaminase